MLTFEGSAPPCERLYEHLEKNLRLSSSIVSNTFITRKEYSFYTKEKRVSGGRTLVFIEVTLVIRSPDYCYFTGADSAATTVITYNGVLGRWTDGNGGF